MGKNISKTNIELSIIAIILILSFLFFSKVDALEKIVALSSEYEDYEVDEIISTSIVLAFCLLWFSFRRWRETVEAKNIIHESNKQLQDALSTIKTLQGIIPICMHCKEIRDDKGSWNQLEKYICEHSDAQFSHSICKKCLKKYYPELDDYSIGGLPPQYGVNMKKDCLDPAPKSGPHLS